MRYCFRIESEGSDAKKIELLAYLIKGQRPVPMLMSQGNTWFIDDDPGRASIFAFSLVSIGLSFHYWREGMNVEH
jgi:hypothetical protein